MTEGRRPGKPIKASSQLYSVSSRGKLRPIGPSRPAGRIRSVPDLHAPPPSSSSAGSVSRSPSASSRSAASVAPNRGRHRAEGIPARPQPARTHGTTAVRSPRVAGSRRPTAEPSLAQSSRIMAVASFASRVTGFLRQVAITAAIGLALIGDAYNTANTLPNQVYELLLGGVLTSVVVPLLVHAQANDADGGEAYTQRLLSLTVIVLGGTTVIAIILAPELTGLLGISGTHDKVTLATTLARLLLVEIVFYGIGAMFGAILNTRGVYGPPAWAPVVNNVVVIVTAGIFFLMPGPVTLDVHTITTAQVLVLGIGTTLGIIAQTAVLTPALRKAHFHWRFRLDVRGSGLGKEGKLLGWVVLYVAVSQVGYTVIVRLANSAADRGSEAGYAVYTNASVLFQTPYGVIGVALLTALLPRMSRAAAAGDIRRLVSDLSLGSRMTAVGLIPITAAYIALGPAITVMIFAHGRSSIEGAHATGLVLAWSAFGLLPFAMTLLQLRVFYAMKDARTPTIINLVMVAGRVLLCLIAAETLPARHVVIGLAVANSLSFIIGAVLGDVLLRNRIGYLDSARFVRTTARLAIASAIGGVAAWFVLDVIVGQLGYGRGGATASAVLGCAVGGVVALVAAMRLHIEDLDTVVASLRRQLGR